jgi:hypothetical protein
VVAWLAPWDTDLQNLLLQLIKHRSYREESKEMSKRVSGRQSDKAGSMEEHTPYVPSSLLLGTNEPNGTHERKSLESDDDDGIADGSKLGNKDCVG